MIYLEHLNSKFKVALAEFSKLGIKGVLQGDLMFTDDVEKTTIDGTKYYTFQPNTIVYAVPQDSDLGKTNQQCKDWCRMAHNIFWFYTARYESIIWCKYQ